MTNKPAKYYLKSCLTLLLPALIWQTIFNPYLPEPFGVYRTDFMNINLLMILEVFTGLIILIISFFMRIGYKSKIHKTGLILYGLGLIIYLFSWRPMILFPSGDWATSSVGYTSFALSPLILMIGVGLIGYRFENNLMKKIRTHSVYFIMVTIYIVVRLLNALIAY